MQTPPKKFWIVLGVCCIVLFGAAYWIVTNHTPAEAITKAIQNTRIAHFSVRDEDMVTATEHLVEKVRSQNPGLGPISVVLPDRYFGSAPPGMAIGRAKVFFELKDVPAEEIVRYITQLSGVHYTVRANSIYFYPIISCSNGEPPPLTPYERFVSMLNIEYEQIKGRFIK